MAPWPHMLIQSLFPELLVSQCINQFPDWSSQFWVESGRIFKNNSSCKKESNSREHFPFPFSELLDILECKSFLLMLEKHFKTPPLYIDKNLYGGGLNIYEPGQHLASHIDFNFNSLIMMYRCINLLVYFNELKSDHIGGDFQLYNQSGFVEKSIRPQAGTVLAFTTNNRTRHGVNKTAGYYRKSLSIWYYTKKPSSDVANVPHRTLWFN